jgi:hypothetical protein
MQEAFPDAAFFPLGGVSHWMHRHARISSQANLDDYAENSLEMSELAQIDLLVFAGMTMNKEFVDIKGRTFYAAAKRGIAFLGLGVGAREYTDAEAEYYADFLSRLGKVAIITRDDLTYSLFKDRVKIITPGIDCAFALPRIYTPPALDCADYNVITFDSSPIPDSIDHQGRDVIHAHHCCFGPSPENFVNKKRTLISDIPEDYLTLYANTTETHSDRVHACIATLAYGNKAQLYNNTPRGALFKKVGAEKIFSRPTSIKVAQMFCLLEEQVDNIKKAVQNLLN